MIVDFSDGSIFYFGPDIFFFFLQIMLADKQASVEKLEWEVKMSNKKVEDLQGDVSNMGFEISSLMAFFNKISENLSGDSYDDTAPSSYELEAIQSTVSMHPWSNVWPV